MLVSVAIISYNHKPFIKKAIDSVLMQETDFEFEIIIGDDGSTDGTQEILKQYQIKHPQKFRLILAEANEGVYNNVVKILRHCQGKYVAVLEGDDYWTYEQKLQKQTLFLENNSEFSGCCHDTQIIKEGLKTGDIGWEENYFSLYSQLHNYSQTITPSHLIRRTIIPTSSLFFRSRDYFDEMAVYSDIKFSISWILELIVMKKSENEAGKFYFFNQSWSVYRKNKGGLTIKNKRKDFVLSNLMILRRLKRDKLYKGYKADLYWSIANEYENWKFHILPEARQERRWLSLNYLKSSLLHTFHRFRELLNPL
ncbi:MAG: glycosyltransferase [Bacteroidota bacterium]